MHTHSPGELAHDHGGSDFIWEKDHEARSRLWKARHDSYYAELALQPGKKVTMTDFKHIQFVCNFVYIPTPTLED